MPRSREPEPVVGRRAGSRRRKSDIVFSRPMRRRRRGFEPFMPGLMPDDVVSQAAQFSDVDEELLLEMLGLSFTLWKGSRSRDVDFRKYARVSFRNLERIDSYRPLPDELEESDFVITKRGQVEIVTKRGEAEIVIAGLKRSRADLQKQGRKYLKSLRKKLFQKICVEKEACKWGKEILGDSKSLLRELIPLVGVALGLTIPAIVITVAILIVKWGIITFCKCPKP